MEISMKECPVIWFGLLGIASQLWTGSVGISWVGAWRNIGNMIIA
jgi:hypothetical protein